jgi:hypothetical protein
MTQEIVELVHTMGSGDWDEALVERLSQAEEREVTGWLRPGVTAQDCGGAFPIAAAWMVLSALYHSEASVESFSAGDLTIRTGGDRGRELEEQARRLMAPYCTQSSFAFQGVRG